MSERESGERRLRGNGGIRPWGRRSLFVAEGTLIHDIWGRTINKDVTAMACRCLMMYMYKIKDKDLAMVKIGVLELDQLNEVGCLFNPSHDPHQFQFCVLRTSSVPI